MQPDFSQQIISLATKAEEACMSYKKSQENERDCVVGFVWSFGWFLFAFSVAVTHFECALFGEAKTAFLEGSLL